VARSKQAKRPLPAKQPLQSRPYQALASRIKARAEELGLSVRDLAARIGRPRTTVHKTLSGQRRLDPMEFLDWCEALEWDEPLAVIESVRRR
jgi:transcriptional regulator with XRE-family HTH domain